MHKIFNGITDQCDREIRDTLKNSGGFTRITSEMLTKAFRDGAEAEPVSPARAVEIDPNINRPYRESCRALEGDNDLQTAFFATVGLLAVRMLRGHRTAFEVRTFPQNDMTLAIVEQLEHDTGRDGLYCGLFWHDGDDKELLAVYYPKNGVLAAAPGIPQRVVEDLDLPFLTWDGQACWSDPMPHLSPDCQRRLRFMVERLYPARLYPGAAAWLEGCGVQLDDAERRQLKGLVRIDEPRSVVEFIGEDRMAALTVPGCRLPEVFMPQLAVMQCGHDAQPAHMGDILELNGTKMHVLPPMTSELLDSDCAVLRARYLSDGSGSVRVDLTIRCDGEILARSRTYAADEIVDITAAPAVLQNFHMANVSDSDWNGRFLIATNFSRPNRNNIASVGYSLAEFGEIDSCIIRPNGRNDVERFMLTSKNAEWALYKTGIETKYATLCDINGAPVVNLMTEPAACRWTPGRYMGTGYISLDGGTTTSHLEVVLDDLFELDPQLLDIRADELCQPIGPMDPGNFDEICRTIGLPDFHGPLHPTAVQRFHMDGAPGDLEFPGGMGRLLNFSSDDLAKMTEDREGSLDLFLNMKGGSSSRRMADENEKAYIIALATFVQMAYLWLTSHGQRRMEILMAYPGGARQPRALCKAVNMVARNIPHNDLHCTTYTEAQAAGEYVRRIRPNGLPIGNLTGLVVIDLGGSTSDIDVCRDGESCLSESLVYASNISQLSAGLALMRRPHEQARRHWNNHGAYGVLNGIFGHIGPNRAPDVAALAASLSRRLADAMASGEVSHQLDAVYDEKNRKLLEQLYRTVDWNLPDHDAFTLHWHELWALPYIDILTSAVGQLQDQPAIAAFVGSGSIFLKGVLQADPAFKQRIDRHICDKSHVTTFASAFVGDANKPEVARGMIYAHQAGLASPDGGESEASMIRRTLQTLNPMLPEHNVRLQNRYAELTEARSCSIHDVRQLTGEILAAGLTREEYDAFVRRVTEEKLVEDEETTADAFGLYSVYDLLVYSADTMGGFDAFENIVIETLENFPLACTCSAESREILLWLIAFNVANRNLLRLQRAEQL